MIFLEISKDYLRISGNWVFVGNGHMVQKSKLIIGTSEKKQF